MDKKVYEGGCSSVDARIAAAPSPTQLTLYTEESSPQNWCTILRRANNKTPRIWEISYGGCARFCQKHQQPPSKRTFYKACTFSPVLPCTTPRCQAKQALIRSALEIRRRRGIWHTSCIDQSLMSSQQWQQKLHCNTPTSKLCRCKPKSVAASTKSVCCCVKKPMTHNLSTPSLPLEAADLKCREIRPKNRRDTLPGIALVLLGTH